MPTFKQDLIRLPTSKICQKTKLQQVILNVSQQLEHSYARTQYLLAENSQLMYSEKNYKKTS